MGPFLARLLGVPEGDRRTAQLDTKPSAMLCVAFLGTLCVCAAAAAAAPDLPGAAYRVTCVIFGTFVLGSLSAVSRVFQQQTCPKRGGTPPTSA